MLFKNYDSYSNPHQQIMMLFDSERTLRFADALRAVVKPTSVVVDVGSGSGILALIAAQAGARRVYAVERTSMARVIPTLAEDNGVADRITVLQKDAFDLVAEDFDEAPDIVVSEMLGHFASGEFIHELSMHMKQLFPNAIFLPERYRLIVTPVWSDYLAELKTLSDTQGVDLTRLAAQARSLPVKTYVTAPEIAGRSVEFEWCEVVEPLPRTYAGATLATRSFNAVAVTWEAEFPGGLALRTSLEDGHSHWTPVLFGLPTSISVSGEQPVEFELATRSNPRSDAWKWTVRSGSISQSCDAQSQLRAGSMTELLDGLGLEPVTC